MVVSAAVTRPAIDHGHPEREGYSGGGHQDGDWLTKRQAQELLNSPNCTTMKDARDRAILAVLVGCGLRRNEAAHLTFEHVQMRESRWVIVDMVGKRNRKRTVPMPAWTKDAIDVWASMAQISSGRILRHMNKGGRITGDSLTIRR